MTPVEGNIQTPRRQINRGNFPFTEVQTTVGVHLFHKSLVASTLGSAMIPKGFQVHSQDSRTLLIASFLPNLDFAHLDLK